MWHALVKLRMHTESTLALFQQVTQDVGKSLWFFTNEVCNVFDTKETPSECQAHQWREKEKSQNKMASVEPNTVSGVSRFSEKASGIQKPDVSVSKERLKKFNMQTYKVHALGDYPRTIHWMGTTDSYSTQIVRLCIPSQIIVFLFCIFWHPVFFNSRSSSTNEPRTVIATEQISGIL